MFINVKLFPITIISCSVLSAASIVDTPLQNEQQRQIYERIQNVDTTIPASQRLTPESNVSKEKQDKVCFITHEIRIHNATMLSETEQHNVTDSYLGKCNGIQSLNALADALTKLYIDKGYITSRVYIVPQDISDGIVDLYAIEGKIARVISDNSKTAGAFIGLEDDLLDLNDLETAIEQVNRLRSNETTMKLIPSNTEGSTDVVLNTNEKLPFFASFSMNNYGSDATGKYQLYGGFVWENFFGFSDTLSINFNTTDKQEKGRKSFGDSFTYSFPLGKWLWEAGLSHFTYNQTVYGLNDAYISRGESDVYSLGTTYKLFHTRTQNIELNGQIARKKNLSLIDSALIETSTYNLSVGKAGMKYVYRQPSWEMYLLLDYYHGLNVFKPTTDGSLKHDFSKWTLAAGATKYFNTELPITYNVSGYAQYSNNLLYSAEQISIGGAYSIRGFQTQNIAGSSGWYCRNDVSFQTAPNLSPYIAYDIGHIKSAEDTSGGTLSSATIGLHARYGAFNFDLYHAIPLTSPDETFDTDPFIGISVSANF